MISYKHLLGFYCLLCATFACSKLVDPPTPPDTPVEIIDPADTVDISMVQIPLYSDFLRSKPEEGSNRAKLDIQKKEEATTISDKRKAAAEKDMNLSTDGILLSFSESYGKNLSRENTPAIAYMVDIIRAVSRKTCPNEYPSAISTTSWATALILCQLNHTNSDKILSKALQIGESAVLLERSSYSAIKQGYIVGGFVASTLRSVEKFTHPLDSLMQFAPMNEVMPSCGDDFPSGYLPTHPVQDSTITTNYAFFDDKDRFWWGYSIRETPRGAMAVKNDTYGGKYLKHYFQEEIVHFINGNVASEMYALIKEVANDYAVEKYKVRYNRERPFDYFHSTNSVGKVSGEGLSYPSGHAQCGMNVGLFLAEMLPEKANDIFRKAYQYAEDRVIVGVHYQTDVEAGMMCAAVALSIYHTSREFERRLTKARTEYERLNNRTNDNYNENIDLGRGQSNQEFGF